MIVMKMEATTRILLQYISKGLTSPEEISQLLETSKSRVYKILECGEMHFKDYEIRALSVYFSSMNRNELSSLFLSTKYGLELVGDMLVDGCILSENAEAIRLIGRLIELFGERKKEEGLQLCDELIKVTRQIKAEFRNLS